MARPARVALCLGALALVGCSSPSPSVAPPSRGSAPSSSGLPPIAPPSSPTTTAPAPAAPECPPRQLALRQAGPVSPATGEHGLWLTLTNLGGSACQLYGYPGVSLYSPEGRLMPFRYLRGNSEYISSAPPRRVVVAPGQAGWILLAKYRCDLGIESTASALRLYPPDGFSYLGLDIDTTYGASALSYCQGGAGDPGNSVSVSAVAASASELLP